MSKAASIPDSLFRTCSNSSHKFSMSLLFLLSSKAKKKELRGFNTGMPSKSLGVSDVICRKSLNCFIISIRFSAFIFLLNIPKTVKGSVSDNKSPLASCK